METAAFTLLIIVSSVLAIFLVIFSIALIFLIRVFKRAAQVADTVESAASAVKHGATAMPFVRIITSIINRSKKGK